jgi:hypothetical protein
MGKKSLENSTKAKYLLSRRIDLDSFQGFFDKELPEV